MAEFVKLEWKSVAFVKNGREDWNFGLHKNGEKLGVLSVLGESRWIKG